MGPVVFRVLVTFFDYIVYFEVPTTEYYINVREKRRCKQERTIQRNWKHHVIVLGKSDSDVCTHVDMYVSKLIRRHMCCDVCFENPYQAWYGRAMQETLYI